MTILSTDSMDPIHLIIYAHESQAEEGLRSLLHVLGKITYVRRFYTQVFCIWEVMLESVSMKIPERMYYMTEQIERYITIKVLNHKGVILRVNYSNIHNLCEYLKQIYGCYNYIFSNTMSGTDNEALVWMISSPVLPLGNPSKLLSLLEVIRANGNELVKDGCITMILKFP